MYDFYWSFDFFLSSLLFSSLPTFPLPTNHPCLHLSLTLTPTPIRHFLHSPADKNLHSQKTGLSSYTVNLEAQTADVYTDSVPFDTVLEKIKKTGKTVKAAEADGLGMGV